MVDFADADFSGGMVDFSRASSSPAVRSSSGPPDFSVARSASPAQVPQFVVTSNDHNRLTRRW